MDARRSLILLSIGGSLLGAPGVAHAATTLHASPTGSTGAATCPAGAPCSIERALAVAVSGDTVIAAAGEYRPAAALVLSEGETLEGAPGPRPAIIAPAGAFAVVQGPTGGLAVATAASMLRHFRLESPAASALSMGRGANAEDLVVAGGGVGTGTVIFYASGVLRSSIVVNTGTGSTAAVMTQSSPSALFSTTAVGTLRNVTAVATSPAGRGILAYAPTGTGIGACSDPVSGMNLRNVIARGGFADIHLLGTVTGTCKGRAQVNADHTNFRTINTDPATVDQTGATVFGLANQTLPALTGDSAVFADATYHQKPTSPTVNAGATDLLPPVDIDGDPIPSLGAPDIGGDEYVPSADPPTGPTAGGSAAAPAPAPAGAANSAAPAGPGTFRLLSGLTAAKRIARATLLRSGLLTRFSLAQPRTGYTLTLTAKMRRKGRLRTVTLGSARAANQADGSVRAALRVSRTGRVALRRAPKALKATLTARVTGADGLAQTSTQAVTITR